MNKISSAQMIEVLRDTSSALQKLAFERDEALAKLGSYERSNEAAKVASAMLEKGLSTDTYETLVERMEKAAADGELDLIRRAVDLSGPDMGEKVARMVDDRESTDTRSYAPVTDLERYLVGDIG